MLISEDVITALARFPPDLRLIIIQYAPEPEWDQYVTGRYNETKEEDARPLGGGKPSVVGNGVRSGVMQWKVDENDLDVGGSGTNGEGAGENGNKGGGGGFRGEFRRASSVGPSSGHVTSTADFGPAPMDEDEDDDDDSVLPGRAPHVRIISHSLYCKIHIHTHLYFFFLFFFLVRSISSARNIFRSFRVII